MFNASLPKATSFHELNVYLPKLQENTKQCKLIIEGIILLYFMKRYHSHCHNENTV
jgi:hypothetical protein